MRHRSLQVSVTVQALHSLNRLDSGLPTRTEECRLKSSPVFGNTTRRWITRRGVFALRRRLTGVGRRLNRAVNDRASCVRITMTVSQTVLLSESTTNVDQSASHTAVRQSRSNLMTVGRR